MRRNPCSTTSRSFAFTIKLFNAPVAFAGSLPTSSTDPATSPRCNRNRARRNLESGEAVTSGSCTSENDMSVSMRIDAYASPAIPLPGGTKSARRAAAKLSSKRPRSLSLEGSVSLVGKEANTLCTTGSADAATSFKSSAMSWSVLNRRSAESTATHTTCMLRERLVTSSPCASKSLSTERRRFKSSAIWMRVLESSEYLPANSARELSSAELRVIASSAAICRVLTSANSCARLEASSKRSLRYFE
mmetsp:Transcript_65121/g.95348  ORF Transcript_65121/g.95348 Transcript_65121/m.95348 type:complete len:247 (-) Transcript_65121:1223-1963(-)